jgi:hypothetical protein
MGGENALEAEPLRKRDKVRQLLKEKSSMVLKAIRPPPKEVALDKDMTFNTKASRIRIEKLPVVLQGYKDLIRYLFFVLVFFTMLYLQTQPSKSFKTINMLKESLLQSEGVLVTDVRSDVSLFQYFVGEIEEAEAATEEDEEEEADAGSKKKKKKKKRGKKGGGGGGAELPLINTIFPEGYYNEQPMAPEDQGHVMMMNSLLGGVLLLQVLCVRVRACVHAWTNTMRSMHGGTPPRSASRT